VTLLEPQCLCDWAQKCQPKIPALPASIYLHAADETRKGGTQLKGKSLSPGKARGPQNMDTKSEFGLPEETLTLQIVESQVICD
jgi:hypothetical protein